MLQREVESKIKEHSSQLEQKANKSELGSPLIASSVSEMTDKTKVYVNTSDGNWYSWNRSNWEKGGVYNSKGINDNSINEQKTTFISVEKTNNIFNKELAQVGKYQQNGTTIIEDFDFYLVRIEISENQSIRVSYNARLDSNPCHVFNSDDVRIANMSGLSDYTVIDKKYWEATMPVGSSYIIINGQVDKIDSNMIVIDKEYPSSYIPYIENKTLISDIKVPLAIKNSQRLDVLEKNNILLGKKWFATGDSITFGHSAELDEDNIRKTYQYYIGKRNNMNIVTDGINGSTMMNVAGKNPFSVNRYKNIPNDVDYITLAFITNDSAEDISKIGTITDNTIDTFYGAWNTVLSYIIVNYPTAKIGIIGFWRGNQRYQYTDALRNIAKKFRIPFLDFMFDYDVPIIGGTDFRSYNPSATEPYVDYNVMIARQNTFLVDTVHLNDEGYKYSSTIIENWLRSL